MTRKVPLTQDDLLADPGCFTRVGGDIWVSGVDGNIDQTIANMLDAADFLHEHGLQISSAARDILRRASDTKGSIWARLSHGTQSRLIVMVAVA